jgi:hypothetical protein
VPDQSGGGRVVERHGGQAGIGVERVGTDAGLLSHPVLQEPVDHDDVAPDELLRAADALEDDLPVMEDELQVEVGHQDASVALAG